MNTTKYFSLLGFLPDTELRLKALIQKSLGESIKWVTATDASLQGVVINADFISSPQIQNYIKRTSANIVCCYHDRDGQQQAKRNDILGLDIREHDASTLQTWLEGLLGRSVAEVYSGASASAGNREPATTSSGISYRESADAPLEFSKNYSELLSRLKRKNGYYLVRYGDNNVWVDVQKNEAFLGFERDGIDGIERSKWAAISSSQFPRKTRRLQLELWLFETLWQSNEAFDDGSISEDGLYKLSRWPRPLCSRGRSEALRLAAFIQSSPATAGVLGRKTGYEDKMVKRFLYAGVQSGQIQHVGVSDSRSVGADKPKQADRKKLGLLQRLRSKLGL